MIAPFWRWDHSLDWPVIDGKLLASGGGGSIAATASFTVDPFSPDSKVSGFFLKSEYQSLRLNLFFRITPSSYLD